MAFGPVPALGVIAICLTGGFGPVPLQAAVVEDFAYTARLWQTDDGLPRNPVHAIAQGPDGYLWVGTQQGLTRFDGNRFLPLHHPEAPELKEGWITALRVEDNGTLWVGCDGFGVLRFSGATLTRYSEANGLANNQVRALLGTSDGTTWVGTENGVSQIRERQISNYSDKHGLGDNSVRALIEDWDGLVRVATRRGLSSFRTDGVITNLLIGTGAVANATRCVFQDRAGALWIGSNDGLVCYRDGKKLVWREELPDRIVTAVLEDRLGQLWVGTYGGLARIIEGRVVSGRTPEAGVNDLVLTLFEDQEGNLWVGTRDGLYRLNPSRFTTYTTEQGLIRNNVMSVLEDRSGAVWIGTWGGGAAVLRHGKLENFTVTNGLSHDTVLSLHERKDGSLCVGMDFEGGVSQSDPERQRFSKLPLPLSGAIRVLHEDRQGRLWIGTSRGLLSLQAGQTNVFNNGNGLPGDTVMALLETRDGALWIGTDHGLACRANDAFDTDRVQQVPPTAINGLYEDRAGTIWVGTKSAGLLRIRDGKVKAFTTREGLFSNEIYEILEDDFGSLWMSCREGIFKVPLEHLEQFDQGLRPVLTSFVFGRADGLLTVQCNGVAKPAGWKARDGRLWFATIRGAVAVQSRIKTNDRPPPVQIEEVRAGGVTMKLPFFDQRDTLVIPPGRRDLEIRFTALSLQLPEKNRFRYRLEGSDSAWIETSLNRVARYYDLPHGEHEFHVVACNNDGVWNETGARLVLDLRPHFWQTTWFRLLLVGVAGLALFGLYRVRVGRLRAISNLRIQIAANLHDDVGARLTKVAMVTEFLDQETTQDSAIRSHVHTIARTTREIIQAMDEIVWTINPRNDTLDHLANYIFHYAQEYFQNTGVRCRLSVPTQVPECAVSTEVRHNLFMTVKEALNNVLKHARAREARIALALEGNVLVITIADDGCGFRPEETTGARNGLNNMRERTTKIGGSFGLASMPGEGTTITIRAPVR